MDISILNFSFFFPLNRIKIRQGVCNGLVHIEIFVVGQPSQEMNSLFIRLLKSQLSVLLIQLLVLLVRDRVVRLALVGRKLSCNCAVWRILIQYMLVFSDSCPFNVHARVVYLRVNLIKPVDILYVIVFEVQTSILQWRETRILEVPIDWSCVDKNAVLVQ